MKEWVRAILITIAAVGALGAFSCGVIFLGLTHVFLATVAAGMFVILFVVTVMLVRECLY